MGNQILAMVRGTVATALALTVGSAAAFAPVCPTALQRANAVHGAVRAQHQGGVLALRAQGSNPLGTAEEARAAAVGKGNTQQQIDDGEAGVGAKADAVGLLYVEVEGEYVDEGYVDEKAAEKARQGSTGGGLFGSLFGNAAAKQKEAALREQQRRDMDVIQFVDDNASPGLMHKRPSYFDPDIVGSSKNSLGLYKTDESRRLGSGRQGSTAPTSDPRGPAPAMPTATAIPTGDPRGPPPPLPLPAGWFAAVDDATGKEYYYTAEGDVTWERPRV